jgi:hypothetical protein
MTSASLKWRMASGKLLNMGVDHAGVKFAGESLGKEIARLLQGFKSLPFVVQVQLHQSQVVIGLLNPRVPMQGIGEGIGRVGQIGGFAGQLAQDKPGPGYGSGCRE